LQIKGRSTTKEERCKAKRHQKQNYHHAMGKRIQCYSDGWTLVGKEYYIEMIKQLVALKVSYTWSVLQGYWTKYQKKVYNKHNEQELWADKEQQSFGEKIDDKDWMVQVDEANSILDKF
jgi:hypothetical protein